MKRVKTRLKLIVLTTAVAMIVTTAGAFACTGVYIGKNVSKEGTTVIARSEDQGTSNYEKMFKVQKRITKSGRYLKDTGSDQKGLRYLCLRPRISTHMSLTIVRNMTECILQAAPMNMALL